MNNLHATSSPQATAEQIRVELGPIVQRPPAELKPGPNNPRQHPEKQIARLQTSMKHFGVMHPVLVTENSEIICGHAVVEAARRLKLPTIPTLCIADMSPVQIRAYRIADNKLAEGSEWDMSLLGEELTMIIEDEDMLCVEALGFDIAEAEIIIDGAGAAKAAPAETIPAPKRHAISRSGDLWTLGQHRVLCGSSLKDEDWDRVMGSNKGHVGFNDPPYNVPVAHHVSGLGKQTHREFAMASGEMSSEEFIAFNRDWLEKMTGHMHNGAVFAACMDWRHSFELESAIRALGLECLNLCIWNKNN